MLTHGKKKRKCLYWRCLGNVETENTETDIWSTHGDAWEIMKTKSLYAHKTSRKKKKNVDSEKSNERVKMKKKKCGNEKCRRRRCRRT